MDKWLRVPVMGAMPNDYPYDELGLNDHDVSVLVGIISQLADNPYFVDGREKIEGGAVFFPHLRAKILGVVNTMGYDIGVEAAKQIAGDCGCNGSDAAQWPGAVGVDVIDTQQQELACRVATKIVDLSESIVGAIVSIHAGWTGVFNPTNYALMLISAVIAILGIVLGGVVIPAIALIAACAFLFQQGLSSSVMLGYWQGVLADLQLNRCERINYLVSSPSPAVAKTRLLGFLENVAQGQLLGAGWSTAVKNVFGLLVPNGLFEAIFDVNLLAMSSNWPCGCGCANVAPSSGGTYDAMFNYANGMPPIGPYSSWIEGGFSYQVHNAVLDQAGYYSLYLSKGNKGIFSDTYFNVVAVFNGEVGHPQGCHIAIDLLISTFGAPHVWVCIEGVRCLMKSMRGRMLSIKSTKPFSVKLSNEGILSG